MCERKIPSFCFSSSQIYNSDYGSIMKFVEKQIHLLVEEATNGKKQTFVLNEMVIVGM